ncbi:MAG TPA: carbon-nitrogen hydrolase family protein [Chloroflexota bacterium]|nr:carbon-nitrogen hydrolase family protein [Chloroflexota bacterium]
MLERVTRPGQAEAGPNTVPYPTFDRLGDDGTPLGWYTHAPRPALRPHFGLDEGVHRTGRVSAVARGGGNRLCFGKWGQLVPIESGRHYRVSAVFRYAGLRDPNLHVLVATVWRVGDKPNHRCPTDYLSRFEALDDGWIRAEEVLPAPDGAHTLDLELYFRLSAEGTVWWDSVDVRPVPPPPRRTATLAAVRWAPDGRSTAERNIAELTRLVDAAAFQGADLVCLPECLNWVGIGAADYAAVAEPIPGPFFDAFADRARAHRIYVLANVYEADGPFVYNTAFLIDRAGQLVGTYRKVHPYWPEAREGVSPGDRFPVFDTDLGRIGVMTCYDSWFPESARALALQGADLLLFPNAGHEARVVIPRAIDNNVYVVCASLNSETMIVNTLGDVVAATKTEGVVTARVDLDSRPSPHPNAGGTCNASPGGRRAMRHAPSPALFEDILAEATRLGK